MSRIVIDNIEIPHSDVRLFKRVRDWLKDVNNFMGSMHPRLPLSEVKFSAEEMLKELKDKTLILLFASAVPLDRVTHHPSFYINEKNRYVIELFVPESVQISMDATNPENALRQIGEKSLEALALDALALYTDNVYCLTHRKNVTFAPGYETKAAVAVPALI